MSIDNNDRITTEKVWILLIERWGTREAMVQAYVEENGGSHFFFHSIISMLNISSHRLV